MRYPFALACALLVGGCMKNGDFEMTRYHEDGRAKPLVALAPLIDTTSFDASWSLSDEFTTSIAEQIGQRGQIYIVAKEDDPSQANLFSTDLSWIKEEFADQDFAVFLELVEHELVPIDKEKAHLPPQEVSTNLKMAVRLRVVDLRSASPKIALQEMVKDTYFIPKTLILGDYNATSWGHEEFRKSPIGIAHAEIIAEISNRISDYILLSKSR